MTTKAARLGPSFSDEMLDEAKLHPARVKDARGKITTFGFGDGVSWSIDSYSYNEDEVSPEYIARLKEMVEAHDHTKARRPDQRAIAITQIKAQSARMRAQSPTDRKTEVDTQDFDDMLNNINDILG